MKVTGVVVCLVYLQLARAEDEVEVREEAPYDVIKTGPDYEERAYPATRWVCHNTLGVAGRKAVRNSFLALFKYITGSNEEGEKIKMTAPVTMHRQGEGEDGEVYQMCFYIPSARQTAPPLPTNPDVYIEDRPSLRVMARTFGGFARKGNQWISQAKQLKESLQKAGETDVNYKSFYSAGYDSPRKLEDRRNEVWYIKEN